jgi:hypothetical protein
MELVEKGITLKQLNYIKFIYNERQITDHSVDYDIDTNIIIWLLIDDDIIKKDYMMNIIDKKDEDITQDIASDINKKTIELFQEPDFKELLRIITTKPHLLNKVSAFITSGDIREEIDMSIKMFNSEEYEIEYNHINLLLDYRYTDMVKIKSVIKHFNGHINLSLRYILTNSDKFIHI